MSVPAPAHTPAVSRLASRSHTWSPPARGLQSLHLSWFGPSPGRSYPALSAAVPAQPARRRAAPATDGRRRAGSSQTGRAGAAGRPRAATAERPERRNPPAGRPASRSMAVQLPPADGASSAGRRSRHRPARQRRRPSSVVRRMNGAAAAAAARAEVPRRPFDTGIPAFPGAEEVAPGEQVIVR